MNKPRSFWDGGYADLASKIDYKAKIMGVPVKVNCPKNTSRRCPECGHIDKANRKTRDRFECIKCGYTGHADHIGAINNRLIAVEGCAADVNQPNAPGNDLVLEPQGNPKLQAAKF